MSIISTIPPVFKNSPDAILTPLLINGAEPDAQNPSVSQNLLTATLEASLPPPYNSAMSSITKTIVLCLFLALLAGCQQNAGWVIRPVPVNQELEETQIARDRGLVVPDKVAIIDLDGMIMNQRRGGLLGDNENPTALFIEKVDKAAADSSVRAIVLRLNSPGGGVAASDICYAHLLAAKKARQIPVVAVFEDMGTSGAYYIACAADKIIAHPASITGAVGVIAEAVSINGTLHKIGIDVRTIAAGPHKAMANPFEPLSDKDMAILQSIVDGFQQRFLGIVRTARPNMTADQFASATDGRVFSAPQALDLGLIDSIGYVEDAIAQAKSLAGISRARVVIYHRPMGYSANAYAAAPVNAPAASTTNQFNLLNVDAGSMASMLTPQFMYLWTGR